MGIQLLSLKEVGGLYPKTATSQFRGGIIMEIGMALAEETVLERKGRIVNRSLAEYHVPVHLDVPTSRSSITTSPMSTRRTASAKSASPVRRRPSPTRFSTRPGKRIRELPITLDKVL